MAHMTETVFSEFFLQELGFIFSDGSSNYLVECVGKLEETMETKTITKKCRGVVKKSRTKGSSGTVKVTAHLPYELKLKLYSMAEHATGVYGYGTESLHEEITITAKVLDEDDNVQYRAYPVAVCNTKSASVDDDATEVPMDELEFTVTADDNNEIVYQALEDDIDSTIAESWMESFTAELIAATA